MTVNSQKQLVCS